MRNLIERAGAFGVSQFEQLGDITVLTFKTIRYTFTPPYNLRLILEQVDEIGIKSIPIAILSAMAIGMVMVLQIAYGFKRFGASALVGPVVSIAIVRELGPVITSLLVGGRTGAGITAEIGSMKVTEQVDAIRALGADPIKKLLVPRVVASVVVFPLLCVLADIAGILSGMLLAGVELAISPQFYIRSIIEEVTVSDFLSGILKTIFFGFIVATISCYLGMTAEGGTQGVGRATTLTVVLSLVLILISDFLLTKLFLVF